MPSMVSVSSGSRTLTMHVSLTRAAISRGEYASKPNASMVFPFPDPRSPFHRHAPGAERPQHQKVNQYAQAVRPPLSLQLRDEIQDLWAGVAERATHRRVRGPTQGSEGPSLGA